MCGVSGFGIGSIDSFDLSGLLPGVLVLPAIAAASLGAYIGATVLARRSVRDLHELSRPGLLFTALRLGAAPLLAIAVAIAAVCGFGVWADGNLADSLSPWLMPPLSIAAFVWAARRAWPKAVAPVRRLPVARAYVADSR